MKFTSSLPFATYQKTFKLCNKRKHILSLVVVLSLLAFSVPLYFIVSHSLPCLSKSTSNEFADVATTFLRVYDTKVSASAHATRLVEEKIHTGLVPFLAEFYRHSSMYVVQVGANVGNEFVRGTSESDDDPVVEAVVHPRAKGLLIEPVPDNFRLLVRNAAPYSDRFQCMNVAIMFGGQSSRLPFYMMNERRVKAEFKTAPQWFTSQLGSFNRSHIVKHIKKIKRRWTPKQNVDYYIKKIHVKTLRPRDVLDQLHTQFPPSKNQDLSMLHVDAEGLDWPIAQAFLKRIKPNVVIFEQKHMERSAVETAMKELQSKGYFSWIARQNLYAVQIGVPRASAFKF